MDGSSEGDRGALLLGTRLVVGLREFAARNGGERGAKRPESWLPMSGEDHKLYTPLEA